jgi:hypothetical protein
MQRKQIQFTTRQAAAIRREARKRGTSDADIVRQAVDRLLAPAPPDSGARAQRIARALAAVGQVGSGRHDISVEHDRELDDIYGS